MTQKIIAEGAEAKIIKINEKILKKIREKKPYRLKEIDFKLRKSRNKKEFKILKKLEKLTINAPKAYEINNTKISNDIFFTFEYLNGNILKKVLTLNLLNKAFEQIIKLHQNNIIHKDLTTFNMIELQNKIYLIDFGLSEFSSKIENKAVDLNLFFNCIKNEHNNFYKYKKKLLKNYEKKIDNGKEIIKRLEKIEHRGRNKN